MLQLNITWAPVVDAVLIDDYEVGLSSVHGSSAPDIMRFQSSRRHTHILINHFGVPEGKLFYIIIKTISKSNVMGSQVRLYYHFFYFFIATFRK